MFHGAFFLNSNQRAVSFVFKARKHTKFDLVLAGELDRADLENLGTEAGHFQHLFEGDGLEFARFRHDARVGGIDPVDVSVDLALVGLQRGGQCDGRGVRAATTEGGDIAMLVGPLEAGDDDDIAFGQCLSNPCLVDFEDARLGKGAVCQHGNL